MHIHSHLHTAELSDLRVFLRADLNVPLYEGHIQNDFRLKALRPTLDLLLKKKARVILATHIGRPQGFDKKLSTQVLVKWFENHNYPIAWVASLEQAHLQSEHLAPQTILLLENMRFYKGEQSQNQQERAAFAEQLKKLGDYYVNDAFALLHRDDTSITLLPQLYTKKHKTIGLLVERELDTLSDLFAKPKRPFMIIIGGGKVKDKLPFIEQLLDKVDIIMILPALVFTFLKAMGQEVGLSLVDTELLEQSRACY